MALFLGGSHVSPAFGDAISVNVHNQSKTITPTKSVQTLVPDPGYTGMSQVTVESIPSSYIIPSGTLNISSNSVYNVDSYANVNVSVNVSFPEGAIVPSGTYTVSSIGTFDIKNYASLNVAGGSYSREIEQDYTDDEYYTNFTVSLEQGFYSSQTIDASAVISATSISYIVPTTTEQVAVPADTYTINEVIVNAIPNDYVIPSGTLTVSSPGSYNVSNYMSLIVDLPVYNGSVVY